MSLIERMKQGSELKSTVPIGKLFERFMTRSAKKLDLTELLQKYLKILYGWPVVEQAAASHECSCTYHLKHPEIRPRSDAASTRRSTLVGCR